jgi:hypothetical protein
VKACGKVQLQGYIGRVTLAIAFHPTACLQIQRFLTLREWGTTERPCWNASFVF